MWDMEADGAGAWPCMDARHKRQHYDLVRRGSWVSSVPCELSNTGKSLNVSGLHLFIYKPGR